MKCVVESSDELGEGPVWSPKNQMIYWLDIIQRKIHRFRPKDRFFATATVSERVVAIAAAEEKEWIGLTAKEVIAIDPDTGKWKPKQKVEKDKPHNRFNDAKCDHQGHYWAGTMNEQNMEQADGSLYRIDGKFGVKKMAGGIRLCNGMGWSPDKKTMYVNETFLFSIVAYDFHEGEISNRRIFAKLERKENEGGPDGLTVDSEGFVWCAHYGAGRVIRFSPQGKIDFILELPAPNVTSCTFGGEFYETLFITTARQEMDEKMLKKYPLAGGLFAFQPGVRGLPDIPFKVAK